MKKKRLFVDNGRPYGTVVLNWHGTPEDEFTHFAEAFRVVAQESIATLRRNGRFGLNGFPDDFRAYPVVFLYRHALELYMKAVLLVGSPMLALKGQQKVDRKQLLQTHGLDWLRQELERVFDAYGWEWDLGTPHFRTIEDLRRVISEFHAVDAKSDAFRYPVTTKGLAALKSDFRFNLFEFCDLLDELFPTLEGAAIGAYEELQAALEASGEAHEYEMENAADAHDRYGYELDQDLDEPNEHVIDDDGFEPPDE